MFTIKIVSRWLIIASVFQKTAHNYSGVSGALFFWRPAHYFLDNRKIICGSYDFEEESDPVLNTLVGASLTNLTQLSPQDFLFEFSNGISVNILGQSGTASILKIIAPEDKYLEYLDGKWNESSSVEPLQGLNNML